MPSQGACSPVRCSHSVEHGCSMHCAHCMHKLTPTAAALGWAHANSAHNLSAFLSPNVSLPAREQPPCMHTNTLQALYFSVAVLTSATSAPTTTTPSQTQWSPSSALPPPHRLRVDHRLVVDGVLDAPIVPVFGFEVPLSVADNSDRNAEVSAYRVVVVQRVATGAGGNAYTLPNDLASWHSLVGTPQCNSHKHVAMSLATLLMP